MTQEKITLISPSEDELSSAVSSLKLSHPSLGQVKLLAQLKNEYPTWSVSEKRLKKVLQTTNNNSELMNSATPYEANPNGESSPAISLARSTAGSGSSDKKKKKKKSTTDSSMGNKVDGPELIAKSGIDSTLNVKSIAPKLEVRMFGGGKGKGLVVEEKIEKGEVVWQEEPWIACPDPQLQPHLNSKTMCTHCLTLFPQPNPPLSVSCPHCPAHFCNRLCQSRSRTHASHLDILCPGQNPGALELGKMIRDKGWRALDVAARIVGKWRSERERGGTGGEEAAKEIEKRIWGGMARVNIEEREKERMDWNQAQETHRRNWTTAHALLKSTLNPSPTDPNYKTFQTLISTRPNGRRAKIQPLTEEEEKRWFSYESFLELLGLANINMEDSGGLYAIHAHLNHSCDPNMAARNLPKSYTPPTKLPTDLPGPNPPGVRGTHKLTLIARRPIQVGEELTISYVNFNMGREARREALREGYGFWCVCERCEQEKSNVK